MRCLRRLLLLIICRSLGCTASAWLPRTNLRELGDNPTADDLLVSHFAVRANRRKYKGKSWGKSIGEEAEDLVRLRWSCRSKASCTPG